MTVISPTIGRVVWYHPYEDTTQTLAAIVTRVWNDRMVNLATFNYDGNVVPRTSVYLAQDGDLGYSGPDYCEWMPYQKGQAAKTEALEAKLK